MSFDRRDLLAAVERFRGRTVLVLGDVMLDRYWWGSVTRISPEAPVPVVRRTRSSTMPGGAANAAANVAALGARAVLFGLVGDDEAAGELRRALAAAGLDPAHLVADPGRATTVKTRVVAHQQHVVRVDEEDTRPLAPERLAEVAARVRDAVAGADAVLVSDYAKGFLVPELLAAVVAGARARGVPVLVDPKGTAYERYAGATVITPNRGELAAATGRAVGDHPATLAAAAQLCGTLRDTAVLATEGEEGMTLVRPGTAPVHLPTHAKRVFDVTGAGDTVIATLAVALAGGADLVTGAWLANRAAGLAVEQVGTVAVSAAMLAAAIRAEEALGELGPAVEG